MRNRYLILLVLALLSPFPAFAQNGTDEQADPNKALGKVQEDVGKIQENQNRNREQMAQPLAPEQNGGAQNGRGQEEENFHMPTTPELAPAEEAATPPAKEEDEEKPAEALKPSPMKVRSEPLTKEFFYEKENKIITEKVLLNAGYFAKNDHPAGYITSLKDHKETALPGDTVFINHGVEAGIKTGDRFFVYKKGKTVSDPETKQALGYLINVIGIIQITEAAEKTASAKIVDEYAAIFVGNSLIPEYNVKLPMVDPDKPLEVKIISGVILSDAYGRDSLSTGDVVYLNIGSDNNVAQGDVFSIFNVGAGAKFKDKIGQKVGKLQVFTVRKDSSTAMITYASDEIRIGNRISYSQER